MLKIAEKKRNSILLIFLSKSSSKKSIFASRQKLHLEEKYPNQQNVIFESVLYLKTTCLCDKVHDRIM